MTTPQTLSRSADAGDSAPSVSYRYRPRLVGAEFVFRLEADALAWDFGRRSGRIAYRDIVRLRLGYRPANLAGSRFIAEIWSRGEPKLQIASVTQRSLFDFQNLAAEYRAFVIELASRIKASGGTCRYDAGFPLWRWWPAVFIALTTLAATIYVAVYALIGGHFAAGATIAALGLIFLWQVGLMITRNRPRLYDPVSIPRDVLP